MTKKALAQAIITSMTENGESRQEVEARWKPWLMRQTKEMLETIYENRKNR